MLLTDVAGINDDDGNLISDSSSEKRPRRRSRKASITAGMIPKVECAIDALAGGVGKIHIIDGRVSHAVCSRSSRAEAWGRRSCPTSARPARKAAATVIAGKKRASS